MNEARFSALYSAPFKGSDRAVFGFLELLNVFQQNEMNFGGDALDEGDSFFHQLLDQHVVIQRLFSHPSNATLQRASEGTPESLRKKEHSWNVDELFRMATESGKRG